MTNCKNFIRMGDRLFLIKRIIKTFNPEKNSEKLKVLFDCDTLLKRDGIYFFCDEVKDAEIIEEIKTNP